MLTGTGGLMNERRFARIVPVLLQYLHKCPNKNRPFVRDPVHLGTFVAQHIAVRQSTLVSLCSLMPNCRANLAPS